MEDTQEALARRTVAMVTLGCARNEVDSEELAGRLAAEGWDLVEDAASADAVVVNTCGFVDAAKKDSIDTILAAADLKADAGEGAGGAASGGASRGGGRGPRAVVAVGCLAERYGKDLAAELPEADAVLGFDDYPQIAAKLTSIIQGESHVAHAPQDRRLLLPISPVERRAEGVSIPGHAATADDGRTVAWNDVRRRLGKGPVAALKLASGCDRRCTFCAIPTFRGAFISRRPHEVLDEAAWLVSTGVRELVLVSENSTSYGKDLGDIRLLESLLPEFEGTGAARVRVSYLQPAEMRPTLVSAMASTPVIADYFDLSFQHASGSVLRRMRRFGDPDSFLELLASIRRAAPTAGVRSNVIVGFPGETEAEFAELCTFLEEAGLDAIGVFGYSDEDGTEAESFSDKLSEDEISARVEHVTALAEELTNQRALDRLGEQVEVLVESVEQSSGMWVAEGRAAHQGPDDGATRIDLDHQVAVGDMIRARVIDAEGIDLVAERIGP